MLQEAFKFLFDAGRQSAPAIVKADAEPDHCYYLRSPDGSLEFQCAHPAPSKHTALSLQAIADIAKLEGAGEVWYSPNKVTILFGDALRDRADLILVHSDQIKQLIQWKENRAALTQPELIRVLRTTFRDSLSSAPVLLETLKKIRFNTSSAINAEVGHGKSSVGKELMAEVTGTGQIPEYVTFMVPVFANPFLAAIRFPVECALDPDASTGQFRVIPLPAQIETALDYASNSIAGSLTAALPTGYPVYYGTP